MIFLQISVKYTLVCVHSTIVKKGKIESSSILQNILFPNRSHFPCFQFSRLTISDTLSPKLKPKPLFFPSANSAGMFGIWSDQSGNEAKTGNKLIYGEKLNSGKKLIYRKKLKSGAEKSHEWAKITTWVSLSIRCDPLTTSDVIYCHKLSWNLINSQWSSQCISLKILFWWTIYHGWG